MFIIIPLALIFGSLAAMFFIMYKKLPQLKSVSSSENNGQAPKYNFSAVNLFNNFFPEITEYLKKIKFGEYKTAWLADLKKILRRLRVVSLKIDRFSDQLIKKIRTVGDSAIKTNPAETGTELERTEVGIEPPSPIKVIKKAKKKNIPVESLKAEEHKLIIEIAKNPKDYRLYETLGDLYVQMANFGDAKESYEAAIELNPHSEVLIKKHSQVLKKVLN